MSAGVRAGAEGHSRPPAANARQSSSQRAELLLGGRLTTSGSGGPCARQSLGQEVLESQGALPGGRPSLSPAPRGPPTRTTHCGPQELGRRGGGNHGAARVHWLASAAVRITYGRRPNGELFWGEIFWCYLRADFWDFYGCMISGGSRRARPEGPLEQRG